MELDLQVKLESRIRVEVLGGADLHRHSAFDSEAPRGWLAFLQREQPSLLDSVQSLLWLELNKVQPKTRSGSIRSVVVGDDVQRSPGCTFRYSDESTRDLPCR